MTLYNKLVTGMLAVFLLLIGSVLANEFTTTRNFLEQQQRSEMNNTMNTVGLALAPYLEDKDSVAAESVINALFDGSSYSVVKLTLLDTNEEIVRSYKVVAHGVPQWFIDLNFLTKQRDSRVITSGWLQLAEIEIVSHPGDAYEQLWAALMNLLFAFGVAILIGLFLISFMLKRSLKPLDMIIRKMQEIAENKFGEPLVQPKTKDLIPVVNGINNMSRQIEKSFKAQAKEAQQLRERAYLDPVSRLGNRSFFMAQLSQWLNESANGGVALLQVQFIKDVYDEQGYESGDRLVKELANQLQAANPSPAVTLARLNTEEFGFIFPNISEQELKIIAEDIISHAKNVCTNPTGSAPDNAILGAVYNTEPKSNSDILSLMDNAISQAHSSPEKEYGMITEQEGQNTLGKQQWKALVDEAIVNQAIHFKFQSASNAAGNIFHKEVFSAIEMNGERYTANQYLFALEQLNAGYIFDKYVISNMIDKLEQGILEDSLAINLTVSSVIAPSFIRWLTKELHSHQQVAPKLHFEIPELCFIHHQHHTALLCNAIKVSGAKFGVDNYGRHFYSLDYVNEFRPNYVKLDYLYTHQIEDEKQQYTLTSIARTAHDLGITTIASRVETQIQLDFLSEHFVEVYQGFIVDK